MTTSNNPTSAEVTDERLLHRLTDMGIECCDLAAARITALRERAEAAERRADHMECCAGLAMEGRNVALAALTAANARAQDAKRLCEIGAPLSAYNLAEGILADLAALRKGDDA